MPRVSHRSFRKGAAMRRAGRLVVSLAVALMILPRASGAGHAQQSTFRLFEQWADLPAGFAWGEIADADLDAPGNLWVLHRPPTPGGTAATAGKKDGAETPVLMFARAHKLVKTFGKAMSLQPHGLHVDPEGTIWVTDSCPFQEAGRTIGS